MSYDENRRPSGSRFKENSPRYGYMDKLEKETLKRKMTDSYHDPPPAYYTCNRCGEKGHHLQVCPTNLDPTYDKPPAFDYVCEICNAEGQHFKSLCPRNTDPYSIIQKRKRMGTAAQAKERSGILSRWEQDTERKREAEETDIGREHRELRKRAKIEDDDSRQLKENRRPRVLFNSSSPVTPDRSWNGMVDSTRDTWSSPIHKYSDGLEDSMMEGVVDGNSKEYRGRQLTSVPSQRAFETRQSSLSIRLKQKNSSTTGDYEIDIDESDNESDARPEQTKATENTRPSVVYSPFILDLVARNPKLAERVNPAPRRKTALEMWDAMES